jgi:hypothetical protein
MTETRRKFLCRFGAHTSRVPPGCLHGPGTNLRASACAEIIAVKAEITDRDR